MLLIDTWSLTRYDLFARGMQMIGQRHQLMRAVLTSLCLFGSQQVHAQSFQTEDSEIRRYAVIVANNKSIDPSTPDLKYADDDGLHYAQLLAPYAQRVELLALLDDDTQSRVLQSDVNATLPTFQNLLERLQSVYTDIRAERARTELMFIFVGHGSIDHEGKGYVHLSDGRLTRADLFYHLVASTPATMTHVIIDACNAYSLVAGRGRGGSRQASDQEFKAFLSGHDLADYPTVGVLVATSENAETHEWSRIRSGLFSYQVRSALTGAADVNQDGKVEYSEAAAFIDAANDELIRDGQRSPVFAWPPRVNRRAPLLDRRTGKGIRHLFLADSMSGHLYLETSKSQRWMEMNKPAGEPLVLTVPAGTDFFLRGDEGQVSIPAGVHALRIENTPEPYTLAGRGALEEAFTRSLFRTPFGESYYRGYVAGRRHLVAVSERGTFVASTAAHASVPGQSSDPWRWGVGYKVGSGLLIQRELGQGGYVNATRYGPWAFVWELGVDVGQSAGPSTNSSTRQAMLTVGAAYPWEYGGRINARLGFALGAGIVELRSKTANQQDTSVGVGRVHLTHRFDISHGLDVEAGLVGSGYLLTLNGREQFRFQPELRVGLVW